MTFVPYDRPGASGVRRPRAHLRPQRPRLPSTTPTSRSSRSSTRASSVVSNARHDWPEARTFTSAAELAASGLEVDAVEALLPIPLHADGVVELLDYGWHVNLQKPMCNDLADARRMLDAAAANDRLLRVMENYLFYEPLRKLKATVESGELGEVSGYHMKMVGSGRGRLGRADRAATGGSSSRCSAVAASSCSTTAGTSWRPRSGSSGRSRRCAPGSAPPKSSPASRSTRPPRSCGSTTNGIRGVWDITLAPRHVPALRLLHERRALGGHRSQGLRAGQPLHGARHPAAEPRGVRRRRDAFVPRARRRLGQQLPRFRSPLAAVAAHRRGSAAAGAARTPSTSCGSRSPPMRAARPAAPASIPRRWSSAVCPCVPGMAGGGLA